MNQLIGVFLALLLLAFASPVSAQGYFFDLDYQQGSGQSGQVASFTLIGSPSGSDSGRFWYAGVPVQYEGQEQPTTVEYITFYDEGFTFYDDGDFTLNVYPDNPPPPAPAEPSLFTGTFSNPTFRPGTYQLYDSNSYYTLTVTAVPEPATWLMMIVGFGAVGITLRRKHRVGGSDPLDAAHRQVLA